MLCSGVEAEFRWCVVQKDTSPRCRVVLQSTRPKRSLPLNMWIFFLLFAYAAAHVPTFDNDLKETPHTRRP